MESTLALTDVVSKQKVQHIDVFGPKQNPKLKVNLLYNAIVSGSVKTMEDIEHLFFAQSKHPYKQANALKQKLDRKLINSLFFIDVDVFSRNDYEKNQVKSYLFLSAVQILRFRQKRNAAAKLAEKGLRLAIKYDLTEVVTILSSYLLQHYSAHVFNQAKFNKYEDINLRYADYFQLENSAKHLFIYFAKFLNNNKSYSAEKSPQQIKSILKTVQSKLDVTPTYHFNFHTRNALYFKAYVESDINQMDIIATDAIQYFKSKKGFSKIGEFSFLQKAGIVNRALKRYEKALMFYEEALKSHPKAGSIPWYNIRNHLFLTHLHLYQYQKAYHYLQESVTHPSFKKLYELYREPWIIKEAYMHILIKLGKVKEDATTVNLKPFRISRFLNEVEHFSKDKRGLNIAVHIVHILHLLLMRQEDQLDRRLDNLGQYSFRYLRNDETLRSNAFIKMLQKMPAANYHPIKLQRDADKYYQRLITSPIAISENRKEVEVIHFEHLWEIVIEILTLRQKGEI